MEELIRNGLRPILQTDIDDEIIDYIKQINTLEDFEEFIMNIIDTGNKEHVTAYEHLKNILFKSDKVKASASAQNKPHDTAKEDFPNLIPGQPVPLINKKQPQTSSHVKEAFPRLTSTENKHHDVSSANKTPSSAKGKKVKHIKIDNYNFKVTKDGRHPCRCEATEHPLINNCLSCGRIVCAQEGSGPCFFCNAMVCTKEEQKFLELNTKESDTFYNSLKNQKKSKEWIKAVAHRDRLLKADRTDEHKTKLYDDDEDYYKTDETGAHESRKDSKLSLNLATGTVNMENVNSNYEKFKERFKDEIKEYVAKMDAMLPKPSDFEEEEETESEEENEAVGKNPLHAALQMRSKDRTIALSDEYLVHLDTGMCLTIQQPWASLLIAGIKLHEGRTWSIPHRGRLWIHAASREPREAEIQEAEKFYREFHKNPNLKFPKTYPTGCLLGCVLVTDCVHQETYRKQYPDGDSDSPYVLICTNPHRLLVFFPMEGSSGIFKLRKAIHACAKEGILAGMRLKNA